MILTGSYIPGYNVPPMQHSADEQIRTITYNRFMDYIRNPAWCEVQKAVSVEAVDVISDELARTIRIAVRDQVGNNVEVSLRVT